MDWTSFFGGFGGAFVGILVIVGGALIWDELSRRKSPQSEPAKSPKPPSLDDILESQLEQHIVQHFDVLFPGWAIYALNVEANASTSEQRQTGIRYRTEAGEIDLLCIDSDNHFVVVELKRDKAPDKVIAQVDRYMAWIEQTLAQPNQKTRGVIIARSFDKYLEYTLSRRKDIDLWIYNWQLEFKKGVVPKIP